MSDSEQPSRRRKFFNKVLPKSWSRGRASFASPDAQDPTIAAASNAGNNSASMSVSGSISPGHVTRSDMGSYVHTHSPAFATVSQPSTTKYRDGIAIPEVTTSISTQHSSPTPVQHPLGKLRTKENLLTAWHGVEYLLNGVEKCLDGTPFKTPIAAINVLIELGNTIIDNKDALQELLTRTTERLQTVNLELTKDQNAASKVVTERFVGKLITELANLNEMKEQATWKKVLDNQESKQKIAETFKQIDEHMKDLQLYLMIRMDRNIRELSDVLTRLELEHWPRSPKATYDANVEESTSLIREPCTPETRTTILADIYQWATDSSPDSPSIFWLTGEAGSGKSTLAYTVAEHFDDDGNILGGNFFCSRQFGETREQRNIIPTIVYQLARKSVSFAQALLEADKRDSVGRIPSKQMKDLLVDPWEKSSGERRSDFPPYLIIVDALDEINDMGGSAFLAELLKTINAGHLRRLKFLVTSRPDPNIVELCETFVSKTVCHLYDVPRATVKADITTYLKAKLPALKDHEQLTTLADKADGLFVYAATAVRHLTPRANMTRGEQLQLMSELLLVSPTHGGLDTPSLVDELYKQILWAAFSKLNDDLFRTRLNILHTILCTQERVSTSVAAALHSDSDDMRDIADVVVKDLHAVLYIKDGCVLWYHTSFPDFIFTPTRSKFTIYTLPSNTTSRVIDMSCQEASHHALLTHSCFNIMMSSSGLRFNICRLPSSFLLDTEVPGLDLRINESIGGVLKYCSHYWAQHLAQTTQTGINELFTRIEEFLTKHALFWIEAMNLLRASALCAVIAQQARKTVLEYARERSNLAQDLADVANFATYFSASPAALSTPHLYISSLTTWSQDSAMSQHWRRQFHLLPSLRRTEGKGGYTVPLMAIPTSSRVACIALPSDGTRIVSGSRSKHLRVWDASTGAELTVLRGHTNIVHCVAFSEDGTRIVSGSLDRTVRVWDSSSGAELWVLRGHTLDVLSVAISRDGTRIISGSLDKSMRMWDALKGAELKVFKGHAYNVSSVALSGDGTLIVSGSADKTVRVWDSSSRAELRVLHGHTYEVTSVAISRDGTRIASGSYDNSVRVWDASTGAQLRILHGHTYDVLSVAISDDGTRIISGSADKSVRVWDASSGAELKVLSGHTDIVWSVAFAGDSTRVVSGSFDESVRVWDASISAELKVLGGHSDIVRCVAFSNDDTRVVSGSTDKSVRVWEASSGVELKVLNGHTGSVLSAAFSGDGTCIASGSADKSIRVWDALSGVEMKVLNGHTDSVWSIAISHDGTRIVSGSGDKSVRLWNASNGTEMKMFSGHADGVLSIGFSSDGTRIVSGSLDQSVRVWDALSGKELKVLGGHTDVVSSVAFSGDGTRVVSGSVDKSVRVWNVLSGAQLKVFNGNTSSVSAVAISRDGTRVVSGSRDRYVRVWDALSGAAIKVLSGHTDVVLSVAFSSDGTRIVSGSRDESIRVWDLVHDDHALRWTSNRMNWIVSNPGEDRLMWLPQDILGVLNHPHNSLIISRKGSAQVDFKHSKIGSDWAGCYTTLPTLT